MRTLGRAHPRRAAWLLIAVSLLSGCAPAQGDAYLKAMAQGERAYHAGRYGDAARAFEDAASKALRLKDRDEAQLLVARSFQREEAWSDARSAYERLLANSPPGPRAVRAEFELADLAIAHGDADAGWAMLIKATKQHPAHGLARGALLRIVEHEEQRGGPAAAVAWLRGEGAALRGTELDQDVGYRLGLALEASGDREGAIRALVAAARAHPYPSGALTDDALFHAAKIAESLGRPSEAIAYLKELLAPREAATYERQRYDDAQFEIALLYRDALHDRAAARREFHKVYTDFKTSRLRDDALWAEAKLWREDGDQEVACATMSRLARDLPESRYARCAHAVCPALPAKGGACADYILRELDPAPGR